MAAAVGDHVSSARAYAVPFAGYAIMAMFAMYVSLRLDSSYRFCYPLPFFFRAGGGVPRATSSGPADGRPGSPYISLDGRVLTRAIPCSFDSGMVLSQARTGGFRFRTIDEIAVNQEKEKAADVESISESDRISPSVDKKAEEECVEVVR